MKQKEMHFQGKNRNLDELREQIVLSLEADGYRVQSTTAPGGLVIQAQKAGLLRALASADRCFTITISGHPNDFLVQIGIGKWIQNIAVAAAEIAILSPLFLAIDVPEMLWTVHVQDGIAKKIAELVSYDRGSATTMHTETQVAGPVLTCQRCGSPLQPGNRFCRNCGVAARVSPQDTRAAEPMEKICPSCGASLTADDAFCSICGAKQP